ncbi:MAG: ABC transporter permease, partial [Chloroflexota bacterium]|nr:ABC transporter permease [Chloroflexota bacterium]
LRLLLGSAVGKAGVALFLGLVALSLWVVLTYPLDFGRARWSNPAVWADNPQNAPPAWTARFEGGQVAHTVATLGAATETRDIPAGQVRLYRFPLPYDADRPPTGLSLTLTGVTFHGRPPAVLATLIRPDGAEVRLASVPIRGGRPDETAPYRRYYDTNERLLLSQDPTAAQGLAQAYAQTYPGLAVPPNLGENLAAGLFGRPAEDGSGRIVPLPGDYAVQVQAVVADPRDEIAPLRVVLGGTVFGLLGTDGLGRDIWEGLLYGVPTALLIGTLTALVSTSVGAGLGIVSGYVGGATDALIQRVADVINNLPLLPLLLFFVFVLGPQLWLILLILAFFSWPGLAIFVRVMVLQIRSGPLVDAARALGASRWRIMRRHIFPQTAPFVVAQMIFFAPGAILAEAGLSVLGLGDPSIPTWGQMLEAGFRTGALYAGYWWWILPPGLMIVLTALAFMLLSLAMESIVDPRLRERS